MKITHSMIGTVKAASLAAVLALAWPLPRRCRPPRRR